MDPQLLQLPVIPEMPHGKDKDRVIADVWGHYLTWFAREGCPPGRLGRLIAPLRRDGGVGAL
jgi:uncharacterized protein (DUF3820 family)